MENEKCFCHLNGYKVKDADARMMIEEERTARAMAVADVKRETAESSAAAVLAAERATIAAAEAAQYAGNVGDIFDVEWESGGVSVANGAEYENATVIRSGYIPILNGSIGVIVPDGVEFELAEFNSKLEFIQSEGWPGTWLFEALEGAYARITAYYTEEIEASPEMGELITVYAQRAVPCAVRYDEQTLTDEQQAQARANIGAVSEEALAELTNYESPNLSPQATASVTSNGYINVASGWFGQVEAGKTYTFSADFHKPTDFADFDGNFQLRVYDTNVSGGTQLQLVYLYYTRVPAGGTQRLSCTFTAVDDGYVLLNGNLSTLGEIAYNYEIATNIQLELGDVATDYRPYGDSVEINAAYVVDLAMRMDAAEETIEEALAETNATGAAFTSHVLSVAHQGASGFGYPQNTVENIIACAKNGWKIAEFDVRWTSDGVPVLSHDDTRTLYGSTDTITISASTYEELTAVQLFEDASMKISTFYEVIDACKLYGLTAFIELKASSTDEQKTDLVTYLKRRNMLRKCAWLSFGLDPLVAMRNLDSKANVLLCLSEAKDADWVDGESRCATLLAGDGETILNYNYTVLAGVEDLDTYLNSMRDYGFLIGAWTIDSADAVLEYAPYLDYMTSNAYRVENVVG